MLIAGELATLNSIKAMEKYDIDLKDHKSTNINESNIEEYDLILTLTGSHKQYILKNFPNLEGKVYTLKEYNDPNSRYIDIDDPWGLDSLVYESCANEIIENIELLLKKLEGE